MIKLLSYYISHTFINSIKKLLHTWVVLFFLICILFGVGVGITVGIVSDVMTPDDKTEDAEEDVVYEDEVIEIPDDVAHDLLDLGVTAVILIFFALSVFSADKPGVFNMADVNLLFPSPMKPQTVLLFKTVLQMGLVIASSLYLLFQIPNFIVNLGLSPFLVIVLFLAFIFLVMITKLVTVFLYSLTSTHTKLRPYLRRAVYAFMLLLVGAVLICKEITDTDYFNAARLIFAGEYTRFIPVIGWIKAVVMYLFEGNILLCAVFFLLTLLSGVLLIWLTWRFNADFYEDAMISAQKQQDELIDVQEKRRVGKERPDKLRRDIIDRGEGASAFLFKNVSNRFRFAKGGVLTKTMTTYLSVALVLSAVTRLGFESHSVMLVSIVFMLMFFFRSYASPLSEELGLNHIYLVPEPPMKKIFFCFLAGELDNVLDFTVPYIIAAVIIAPTSIIEAIMWYVMLLTFEMAIGCMGTFLSMSISTGLNQILMGMIQFVLKVVMIVPYIVLLILGATIGAMPLFLAVCSVFSVCASALLLWLSSVFLSIGTE